MVTQKSKLAKIFTVVLLSFVGINYVFADTKNTGFNVNVGETLSVSISSPTNWASGEADTFLRNKVNIKVVSNNTNGFTASMTTKTTDTTLVNSSNNTYTIPTLTATTSRGDFPANFWGYSLDDTESGSDTSNYQALVGSNSTPITILSSNSATTGSKDFYFGAKANIIQASGTYTGTVVISVVSGVIDPGTNPVTPVNPVNPNPTPNTPTYDPNSNRTAYTYNVPGTGGDNTTTTIVSDGDTRETYNGYTPPQGVTRTTTSRSKNSAALATSLAVVATVATTSGLALIFIARRDDGDDDEDMI